MIKPKQEPLNILSTDLAYLAGIIDGEGSIIIGWGKNKRMTMGGYFYVRVSVTNTDYALMQWLRDITNMGGISEGTLAPPSNKPRWNWGVGGDDSERLLLAIEPYMIIKKPKANHALEFRDYINSRHKETHNKESFEKLCCFYDTMKAL